MIIETVKYGQRYCECKNYVENQQGIATVDLVLASINYGFGPPPKIKNFKFCPYCGTKLIMPEELK